MAGIEGFFIWRVASLLALAANKKDLSTEGGTRALGTRPILRSAQLISCIIKQGLHSERSKLAYESEQEKTPNYPPLADSKGFGYAPHSEISAANLSPRFLRYTVDFTGNKTNS